jgi:hypothetical protein
MMVGAFLCLLQILLLAHAKVMLEYAAFNAARAGVVQNGSRSAMRAAATISMLPVYCQTQSLANIASTRPGGCAYILPFLAAGWAADSLETTLESFLNNALGINTTAALPQLALVEVTVMNPLASDFSGPEIDFDLPSRTDTPDPDALRKTRLTIDVSAIVPMNIPVGNAIVCYVWLIGHYLGGNKLPTSTVDWLNAQDTQHQTLDQILRNNPAPTQGLTGVGGAAAAAIRETLVYTGLSALALSTPPHFLFPMETSYSMPMESNLFQDDFKASLP